MILATDVETAKWFDAAHEYTLGLKINQRGGARSLSRRMANSARGARQQFIMSMMRSLAGRQQQNCAQQKRLTWQGARISLCANGAASKTVRVTKAAAQLAS